MDRIGGDAVKNPYIHRKRISEASSFLGRTSELRRIYSLLEGGQEISVVGERRIGKSSLLYCLTLPDVLAQYPEYDLSQHNFVYVDGQACLSHSPEEFLIHLLTLLLKSTGPFSEMYIPLDTFTTEHFLAVLDQVTSSGTKLVFLLDEFDSIAQNSRFDLSFFNFLRSVAGHPSLSFVTASTKSLYELCDISVLSSPFFNIFTVLLLKEFTEDESLRLICEPSAKAGIPLSSETGFIQTLAGQHPFLLQITCYLVFEAFLNGTTINDSTRIAIKTEFQVQTRDHFAYAWANLSPQERKAVSSAAKRGDLVGHTLLSSKAFQDYMRTGTRSILPRLAVKTASVVQGVRQIFSLRLFIGIGAALILLGVILSLGLLDGLQEILLLIFVPLIRVPPIFVRKCAIGSQANL